MAPVLRQPLIFVAALALLAGCGGKLSDHNDGRPQVKPEQVTARVASGGQLGLARISTKSGEILILEPDGSVTTMNLDSPAGRDAFAVTEADLMALNANLNLSLPGGTTTTGVTRRGPTAQEQALAAFAAQTKPALPVWREGTTVDPETFIGTRVVTLNEGGAGDLVEVTANLKRGVDADIAFSYATCALAGWAKQNGGKYGRHIRTLQDNRNGKLMIGAAFTVSDRKPMGLRVMETDETLRECEARGIPAA